MVTSKKLNQKGLENVGKFLKQLLSDFIKTATSVPGCEILDQFNSIYLFYFNGKDWLEIDSLRSCTIIKEPEGYYIDLAIFFTFDDTDQMQAAFKVFIEKADSLWSYNKDDRKKRIMSGFCGIINTYICSHGTGLSPNLSSSPAMAPVAWYTVSEDEIE